MIEVKNRGDMKNGLIFLDSKEGSWFWRNFQMNELFMSCPEIKMGMKTLGFQSPNLN
jgi:hypothetical protein